MTDYTQREQEVIIAIMLLAKKVGVDPVQLMADARALANDTEALVSSLEPVDAWIDAEDRLKEAGE